MGTRQIDQPFEDIMLAGLKDQLAREDSEKHKAGTTFAHRMTPSVFIQQALEIETAQ